MTEDRWLYQAHAEVPIEEAAPEVPSGAWSAQSVDVPAIVRATAVVFVQYAAFVDVPTATGAENAWQADCPPPIFEADWAPESRTDFVPVVAAAPEVVGGWETQSVDPLPEEEREPPGQETSFVQDLSYEGWSIQSLDPLWPTAPPEVSRTDIVEAVRADDEYAAAWNAQSPDPVFEPDLEPEERTDVVYVVAAPVVYAAPWASQSPDPARQIGVVWVQSTALAEVPATVDLPECGAWARQSSDPIFEPDPPPEPSVDFPVGFVIPETSAGIWGAQTPDPIPGPEIDPDSRVDVVPIEPPPTVAAGWLDQSSDPIEEAPTPEGRTDWTWGEAFSTIGWLEQSLDPFYEPLRAPEPRTDWVWAEPAADTGPCAWEAQSPDPARQVGVVWVQYSAFVDAPEAIPPTEIHGWQEQCPDPLYAEEPLDFSRTDIVEALWVTPTAPTQGWETQSPDPIPGPQRYGIQCTAVAEYEIVQVSKWYFQCPDPIPPEEYWPIGQTDTGQEVAPPAPLDSAAPWATQPPGPIPPDTRLEEGSFVITYTPPPEPPPVETQGWETQSPDPILPIELHPALIGKVDFLFLPRGLLDTELAIDLDVCTDRSLNTDVITDRGLNADVTTERRLNADV